MFAVANAGKLIRAKDTRVSACLRRLARAIPISLTINNLGVSTAPADKTTSCLARSEGQETSVRVAVPSKAEACDPHISTLSNDTHSSLAF